MDFLFLTLTTLTQSDVVEEHELYSTHCQSKSIAEIHFWTWQGFSFAQ